MPRCAASAGHGPCRRQHGHPVYRCDTSLGPSLPQSRPDRRLRLRAHDRPALPAGCRGRFHPTRGRPEQSDLVQEADQIRRKLDGLAALYEEGILTAKGVRQSSERLKTQLADVDAKLADANGIPKAVRTIVKAADVRSAWESLEVADQREIIRALAAIHLNPPGRGGIKILGRRRCGSNGGSREPSANLGPRCTF